MVPKIIVKSPLDCTTEELENFRNLVLEGRQVTSKGLETRIKNCQALAFYYTDNELVGISAIKRKSSEIVKRTQLKANIKSENIPTLELGYSYTKQKFRGKGINKKLNDQLLQLTTGEKVYATTDNDTMRKYLTDKGFKKQGDSFKGQFNETLDYFEK